MQGKGVIKFFAVLLAAVCLYQLSFTWVVRKVEDNAKAYAKGNAKKYRAYLDSVSTQPVYPLLGHTFQYCQNHELALGLDLQGGMSVTLQVSLRDLVKTLASNSTDVVFNQALDKADYDSGPGRSQSDYITLFVNEYEKLNPNGKLATIFANRDNQEHLKFNDDNAKVEAYLKEQATVAVQQTYTVINTRIDQFGVTQPNIQLLKAQNRILIELPGITEPDRVQKLLVGTAKLEFYKTFENNEETFSILSGINTYLASKAKAAADSAKAKTGKIAKTTANTDTAATKAKINSLLKKLDPSAGTDTSSLAGAKGANQNPLFSILRPRVAQGNNGQLQYYPGAIVGSVLMKDTAKLNAMLASPDVKARIPQNMKFLWGVKPVNVDETKTKDNQKIFELYAIKLNGVENGPVLTGDVVTDARSDVDPVKGDWEVTMSMNSQGAEQWKKITAEAAPTHASIAIVLDNNVYSAPGVENEISGGESRISGNFTQEDTQDLSNVLKAGHLPAPAVIVSSDTVGPTLGAQARNAGLLSSVMGFIVVLIFMIAYYNRAGTIAVIAVLINVFFLMGVLISLNAVLTMPGVAGIVLTLGISVDANVLIYERIREELALGKSLKLSIADGFKHALSSILDSNISTFITGLILFAFGSGPIKGFAVVLMIGIATSLFCSLLISRIIFEWMVSKGKDIKFSNPWSSHTFKNANYAFVKNRFKFYIFSGAFIVAGIISMATQGFNYGVDFVGGRNYTIQFKPGVTTQDIHSVLDPVLGASEVKTYGVDKMSITTTYLIDDNSTTADAKVESTLINALSKKPSTTITAANIGEHQKVKATIAEGLKQSAFWTVLIAIIVISAYILIRFRKWQFSLGAMVATLHDALMVLSFFSLFRQFIPFLDIDQSFIAAILTVIGYSINDTVVVFDRIREFLNLHHAASDDPKEVINHAINKTLSRTIITALTVLFVLIVLFIFGGDVIRGFSFALLVGVCFGTYSSICIATPIIIDFGKKDLR